MTRLPDLTVLPPVAEPVPLLNHLFRPIQINRLTLPNRVLMGSIHLNMDEFADQYERKARFYALRARGAAALIVTAGCSPNAAGNTGPHGFSLDTDALIDRHALITQAVHAEGGKIALQILHFGREAFHGNLVSASPIRLDANIFTPRALNEEEILQTIADFAATAVRAVAAGYDAIELIFSQGFLVHQFLCEHTNRRTDRWGGSLENRMRFAIEIARQVRAAVGPAFPLLFRIPCLDLLTDGLPYDETVALIEALLPYGIDLLNVSVGWHESAVPTIAMVVPRAGFSAVAARIKARFPALTVCVSNRINEPRLAEQLLRDGVADMVSMARPFLADPDIMRKARANQFELINTCIACNQSCLDFVFTGHPVGCSVNPECGDALEGAQTPFTRPMKIAVVGGGLAGMAAALYAARRGAEVDLFEQSLSLGGQLNMARSIPRKSEFGETVRYFEKSLMAQGVSIRCGSSVDAAAIAAGDWDHVFIATGTVPAIPATIPGATAAHVLTFDQVLRDKIPVQFPAVVIGGGGVACDLAKYLAHEFEQRGNDSAYLRHVAASFAPELVPDACLTPGGARMLANTATDAAPAAAPAPVTVLQRSSKKFAYKLGRTTRWIVMKSLEESGVAMMKGQNIRAISEQGVQVLDRKSGTERLIAARTVILAAGQTPLRGLEQICADAGKSYTLIGAALEQDAATSITSATKSAYRAVQALS